MSSIPNQKKSIPPKKTNCFHCQNLIFVKHVRATKTYSQKNNWGYWTENSEYEKLFVCDDCLAKLYFQHKWEFSHIIPKRKQERMRQYINKGFINGKPEKVFITNHSNLSEKSSLLLQNQKKKKKKNEEKAPH